MIDALAKKIRQKITSAETSINKDKLPALFRKVRKQVWEGAKMVDLGAGKFENQKVHMEKTYGVQMDLHDPFNRTTEQNTPIVKDSMGLSQGIVNVIHKADRRDHQDKIKA